MLRRKDYDMKTAKIIRPFHTVLVANRGEIALRILRTVRRLGKAPRASEQHRSLDPRHDAYAKLSAGRRSKGSRTGL